MKYTGNNLLALAIAVITVLMSTGTVTALSLVPTNVFAESDNQVEEETDTQEEQNDDESNDDESNDDESNDDESNDDESNDDDNQDDKQVESDNQGNDDNPGNDDNEENGNNNDGNDGNDEQTADTESESETDIETEETDTETDSDAETEVNEEQEEEVVENNEDTENSKISTSASTSNTNDIVTLESAASNNPNGNDHVPGDNSQPDRVGSHDDQTSGEGANAGGTVTDPTIPSADGQVEEDGVTLDEVTANCFGKVISHEAQEHKEDPEEGTLGEHSSDPVPEIPGNETPRQGIGNQDQGHPAAHGAFNSNFDDDDAENVNENCDPDN